MADVPRVDNPSSDDIIILVHGIRDFAYWEVEVRTALEKNGLKVELTNYARFDLLRFLLPVPWFRNAVVERIWNQIQQVYQSYPGKKISFIAHSFGTFVLAEIMRRKFNFYGNRVIFCGSVVRYDFPFEDISTRFTPPLLNEVGTRDPWPGIAQSITFGYGSAGTYGFKRPNVRDRWHKNADHGYFLTSDFCQRFWVPFLKNGQIVEAENSPELPVWWVRLLYLVKLKYVIAAVLALMIYIAVSKPRDYREVTLWVSTAEWAIAKDTVDSSHPLPDNVVQARSTFENWWHNAGLSTRGKLNHELAYKALSYDSRLYRIFEKSDEIKPSANFWNGECLNFFDQLQDAQFITECLIDRAALFLELSQIEHTDADKFRQIAREGDSVMTRASALASDSQRPEVYRIASRFYYNLARPNLLSSAWSNNYLSLAVDRAQKAYDLQPNILKNATQLSRAVQRMAANPLQLNDYKWTEKLRSTQNIMSGSFNSNVTKLVRPDALIPPANILAVMTMDLARRTWRESNQSPKQAALALELLDSVAVPVQTEAWALVRHTEWSKDYTFDLNYDLGRIRCVKVQILDDLRDGRADAVFDEAVANMVASKVRISGSQLKAAIDSIDGDPNLADLGEQRKARLRVVFSLN